MNEAEGGGSLHLAGRDPATLIQRDLHKEHLCLDLLLSYCQIELKKQRLRVNHWQLPGDTLVHLALAQAGHAARKPGIIGPFAGIGLFLLLALILLPVSLCFQSASWLICKLSQFADWLRDRRQIKELRVAIQQHDSPCGHIYSLWRKFSPSSVGLSRCGDEAILAVWLSILYGQDSGYWAKRLDEALHKQNKILVENHAAFLQENTEIRLIGHPTSSSALRALDDEIPVRYRDSSRHDIGYRGRQYLNKL